MPAKKTAKASVPQKKKNKELPTEAQRARLILAIAEAETDQSRLGKRARVSQAAISRWLSNDPTKRRDMASLSMLRVAQALGVSLHWLLTGDGPHKLESLRPFLRVDPVVAGDIDVHTLASELLGDPPRSTHDRPQMRRGPPRE